MKASTCCFRIKYCKKDPDSYSLYSNEYHALNDLDRIRTLFIRKYYTVPYSVTSLNHYISDNETMESLYGRLNELLRRIANDLGNIIKIENSEPIYDENGLKQTGIASTTTNRMLFDYDILLYNACVENGWNFVDVAYVMRDENGYLFDAYCSDPEDMGMHFTDEGCEAWIEYLTTHGKER